MLISPCPLSALVITFKSISKTHYTQLSMTEQYFRGKFGHYYLTSDEEQKKGYFLAYNASGEVEYVKIAIDIVDQTAQFRDRQRESLLLYMHAQNNQIINNRGQNVTITRAYIT